MRRRFVTAAAAALLVCLAPHAPALAQPADDEGGGSGGAGEAGIDWNAQGEILGGGSAAEVEAGVAATRPGRTGGGTSATPPDQGAPRLAASSGIRCSLWALDASNNPYGNEIPTTESLQSLWDRRSPGTTSLSVMRVCYDADGFIISTQPSTWAPGDEGAPPAPLVDPAVLAATARSRLVFPPPIPRTSPGLDTGTYAQMPTAFWVDGWGESSSSATAGPVTATVTARPVSQEWRIGDVLRGGAESVVCEGPGAPPAAGGQVGPCGWTPQHSSAGQTARGGSASEPCFPVTVTVTWGVAWTANVPGAGGSLGEGTSSTDTCLVVAEVQAVVSGTG